MTSRGVVAFNHMMEEASRKPAIYWYACPSRKKLPQYVLDKFPDGCDRIEFRNGSVVRIMDFSANDNDS